MKRGLVYGAIVFLGLVGMGLRIPGVGPDEAAQTASAQVSSDVSAAFLGGLRPTVANLIWIQAYGHWERRDVAALEQSVGWVLRLEPRNRAFWVQSARMFAYDVPRWEARAALGPGFHDPEVIQPFRLRGAERALVYLDAATLFFPEDPVIEVDRALLHLNVTGDLAAAAQAFRAAWEAPGGPYFAARLYGELLRRLGQTEDALAWYIALLPGLDESSPAAQRETVLRRIVDIERELDNPGAFSGEN
ncbi:MAG: hypothetical protein JJT96_05415 [Opitutales bacterium]|nr:hypothetical protein [Opitutales bacterium]